jgi:hypothetical protein
MGSHTTRAVGRMQLGVEWRARSSTALSVKNKNDDGRGPSPEPVDVTPRMDVPHTMCVAAAAHHYRDGSQRQLPMHIRREWIEKLIFFGEASRRFTQDSPLLPDVWIAFAQLVSSEGVSGRIDVLGR